MNLIVEGRGDGQDGRLQVWEIREGNGRGRHGICRTQRFLHNTSESMNHASSGRH